MPDWLNKFAEPFVAAYDSAVDATSNAMENASDTAAGFVKGAKRWPADILALPGDVADAGYNALQRFEGKRGVNIKTLGAGADMRAALGAKFYGDEVKPPGFYAADTPAQEAESYGRGAAEMVNPLYFAGEAARLVGKGAEAVGAVGRRIAEAAPGPMAGGRAAQAGVVKLPGGNWLDGSVEKALEPLRTGISDSARTSPNPEIQAEIAREDHLNSWIDKQLTRYVKNDMATERDPVRALAEKGVTHDPNPPVTSYGTALQRRSAGFPEEGSGTSEMAKAWEGVTDNTVERDTAGELVSESFNGQPQKAPWATKLDPETSVYSVPRSMPSDFGFNHLIDELRNAVNPASGLPRNLQLKPESLTQLSVPQAVERVAKINEWRAANKAEANAKIANNPATFVHKEYPESGFKWVQLKKPEKAGDTVKKAITEEVPEDVFENLERRAARDAGRLHAVGTSAYQQEFNTRLAAITQDWAEQYRSTEVDKHLAEALKYEGDTMGHCVGGYCPDVTEGRSQIFSLRDSKGEPHVTIEVEPSVYSRAGGKPLDAGDPNQHPNIVQIKGKGNKAPAEKYLPMVQDFVKSGEWGDVGDLRNTGLIDPRDLLKFTTREELAAAKIDYPRYVTEEQAYEIKKIGRGFTGYAPGSSERKAALTALAAALATGAASAGEPPMPAEKDKWLDDFAEPTKPKVVNNATSKALSNEDDYDVSEYAPPANETRMQKLQRLGRGTARDGATNPYSVTAGAGESLLSQATGAISSAAGGLAGVAKTGYRMTRGDDFGTAAGKGAQTSQDIQHKGTYQPRTSSGQLINELMSAPMEYASEATGAVLGHKAAQVGALVDEKTARKAEAFGESVGGALPAVAAIFGGGGGAIAKAARKSAMLAPAEADMAGVGAAQVPEAKLRRARAQELDEPISLTKGQAERTFEQQRFERETAKMPEGKPLRERFADQNETILKNFDRWVEQTGSEAPSLRSVGESVNNAVVERANAAKVKIREAYKEAKESGQMAEEVDYAPVKQIVADTTPTVREKLAPILKAVEEQLTKNDPQGTGKISVNALEDVRKLIRKNVEPGTPGEVYGRSMVQAIDAATEQAGGDVYRAARRMRENYAKEFENRGVVAKLLRTKPGTTDRAVAFEDVFDHTVMRGSMDDVRWMRRTLQAAGDNGKQAWKDLQGQTIQNIKDVATKSVASDERGNPIVSPAALNKIVTELDKDGKLDFIFGKRGAEKIRTVNDIAKDVYTAPPGSVNTSNTATVLAGLLDTAVSGMTALPLPVASAVNYGVKKYKSNQVSKKVQNALADAYEEQAP